MPVNKNKFLYGKEPTTFAASLSTALSGTLSKNILTTKKKNANESNIGPNSLLSGFFLMSLHYMWN